MALAGGLEALAGEFTPLFVQRNAIQSKNENIGGVEGRAYCGPAKASIPAASLIHSPLSTSTFR